MTGTDERDLVAAAQVQPSGANDLWVFGYGSLMWRPGFGYTYVSPAQIVGFTRSFCIYSTHHRGSPERPGLVLGLDRGGACSGMAYCVPETAADDVIAYLRAREQVNGVYRESWVPIWLESQHRQVMALAYIVERAHPSYAGRLDFASEVRLIRAARGLSGPNIDYLVNTARHLAHLGVRDRHLERLVSAIGGLFNGERALHGGDARSRALVEACRRQPVEAPRMRTFERRRFLYRMQLQKT